MAGARISGLFCAYELMRTGNDVTVLEATGRHSGHVFTGRDGLADGLYADFGADRITKPGYERFFEYAEEFDLPILPYPNAEGSPLIFLVNCISLPIFKDIPVKPALSPQKRCVVDNLAYSSHPFYVFETSSKF